MARWPLYLSGERFKGRNGGNENGPKVILQSVDGKITNGTEEFIRYVSRQFANFVGLDAQVYWISPVPEVGLSVPRIFAQGKSQDKFQPLLSDIEARDEASSNLLDQIQEKLFKPMLVIDPKKTLCDEAISRCRIIGDGPLYVDTNHLSYEGAKLLVPQVLEALRASQ